MTEQDNVCKVYCTPCRSQPIPVPPDDYKQIFQSCLSSLVWVLPERKLLRDFLTYSAWYQSKASTLSFINGFTL